MKRLKSKKTLWIRLATIHIVSLIYPVNLVHAAKSVDQNFFAAGGLIGVMFVLVVIDAVSIVVVNADTSEERRAVVVRLLITRFRCAGIELPQILRNGDRDPSYLFACHLEWRSKRDLDAYHELLAALHDSNCDTRVVAEVLLSRSSLAVLSCERVIE
jgi:hypothetical protein